MKGLFTPDRINGLAAVLRDGGVAVLPTDTIYGLHCLFSCSGAIGRIRRIKGRSPGESFIMLASGMDMIDGLVSAWPVGARKMLGECWPAPLAAILPAGAAVPRELAPRGRVAVRVPGLALLRNLAARAGGPLVSTSVNVSGREPLSRMAEIMSAFPGLDAYMTRPGRPVSAPSTIVDFTSVPFAVLRRGRFDFKN